MHVKIATALTISCLFTSSLAQAQASPAGQAPTQYQPAPNLVQPATVPTRTTRYWQQLAAIDLASWTALALTGEYTNSEVGLLVGIGGAVLGAPIVHLAQGNTKSAGYSLAARAGIPLATALLISSSCDDSQDDSSCSERTIIGAVLGYGVGVGLDYFFLAKKIERVVPQNGLASLRPSLQITRSGARAGLAFDF